MKDSRKIRTGALLATLVTAALLAGCTSAAGSTKGTEPAESPRAETSEGVEQGDPPAESFQVGELFQQKPDSLPEGLKAYKLPDATYAVVDPTQPLPDSVRADVQGRVDSQIQDPGTPEAAGTTRSIIVDTAQETASLAGLQSGKSVVVIFPLVGSCASDNEAYLGWAHTALDGADDGCRVLRTLEESRAQVDAAIAATGHAERYEVFVHAN